MHRIHASHVRRLRTLVVGCSAAALLAASLPASAGVHVVTRPGDIPLYRSAATNPSPHGGSLAVARFTGYGGRFHYASNDDHNPRLTLVIINSGQTNFFGAPTPPGIHGGKVLLYLTVMVDGGRELTLASETIPALLRSAHFVVGTAYTMYVYNGQTLIGTIDLGTTPSDQILRFPSPLAGVTIVHGTPLFMVVVQS